MDDPADRAFSLYIRTRDRHTCRRCGSIATDCSHFKGRRKEATRFEPLNCDAMCRPCHDFLGKHPAAHREWQIERKGIETVEWLEALCHTYKKPNRKQEAAIWRQKLKECQ